jgi:hypothetical protein
MGDCEEREGTVIYQVRKSFREDEPEEERGGGSAEDGVPGVTVDEA